MGKDTYLDNSATTRAFDEVIAYMSHINTEVYGNPSSLHSKGLEAEKLVRKARKSIADTLKAEEKEIIFTSGGTEGNNLAIFGALEGNPRLGSHIITTSIEHPSVLEVFKHLSTKGYEVNFLKVDKSGCIDLDELKTLIRPETALISVITVNNETGSIQPLEDIARLKNSIKKEIIFHSDGVQAYGKLNLNPRQTGVDIMTLSAHKIHGPKGVGALYVGKGTRIKPILFGGGQESLLRSGTENVPGIGGFGMAAEMIRQERETNMGKVEGLKGFFLQLLSGKADSFDVISPENGLPYILNLAFEGAKAEVLLHHLAERSIYVSTGSACSSRKNIRSHVLTAMGVAPGKIDGSIRISFSGWNTEEDVRTAVDAISEIVPKIRVRRK